MNGVAQFIEAIFDWTWRSSLYASVLILLVVLVQFAFGKVLPVRWRYLLGFLVLLRLILPAAPESKWSIFNLSKHFASASPPSTVLVLPQGEATQARGSVLPELASFRSEEVGKPIDWMTVVQVTWLVGLAGSLLVVGWQHGRFANWVNGLPRLEDDRVSSLLRDCKQMMNVRREVLVVSTPRLGTPALFGFCKPRLLLPEGTLGRLDDGELRMVFLHELAHVRRGDTLLNWVMIFVRALHWFNPLVWLAMRRLRADRELVCDSMVMARLSPGERRAYGNTLIKLLDDFSGAGFCPSLVPVINNKSEIKRRITMIAKFKSPGRAAVLASVAVVVALCGFTFTRAAERKTSEAVAKTPDPDNTPVRETERFGFDFLNEKIKNQEEEVRKAQANVDRLRIELKISDASDVLDGAPPVFLTPETVRRLESERLTVQADYAGKTQLLEALKRLKTDKGVSELRKVIPTVAPDALLSRLLEDLASTEVTLARHAATQGPDQPETKAVAAMQSDLSKKVDERVEGILDGLTLLAQASRAQLDSLGKAVAEAKTQDAEMTAQLRPYFLEKRKLENLQKVRDAIQLRILQETVDMTLPGAKSSGRQ